MTQFSGNKANIYGVIREGDIITLFDHFINENKTSFISELKNIVSRLQTIGNKTGAKDHFFKLKEGKLGDGVCALYDHPNSNLRLYCIRYDDQLIIVGGGGPKPKSISALQEDPKLTEENYYLRWLSSQITVRIKEGDIKLAEAGFDGDLTIDDYEE